MKIKIYDQGMTISYTYIHMCTSTRSYSVDKNWYYATFNRGEVPNRITLDIEREKQFEK